MPLYQNKWTCNLNPKVISAFSMPYENINYVHVVLRSLVHAWLICFIAFLTSKLAVQIYETIQLLSPQDVVAQSVLLPASKAIYS